MSVASLPMYDLPEVRPALDALWAGLARHLAREGVPDVPCALTHGASLDASWLSPDLLLSQCCGYDLLNGYAGALRPLATPCYRAPGCIGPAYASVVVVAENAPARALEDLRGGVCAINGWSSHSGMSALRALIAPLSAGGRFFARIEVSGSHRASLAMVARGEADVAAIDCVVHALLVRHRPAAVAGTRPLGQTPKAPAPPFVTGAAAGDAMVARLRTALLRAFDAPRSRRRARICCWPGSRRCRLRPTTGSGDSSGSLPGAATRSWPERHLSRTPAGVAGRFRGRRKDPGRRPRAA